MTDRLTAGVAAFQENVYPKRDEEFAALAEGQQPLALFITCSDSRIDPNLLTQTKPGELFVLRNAGNLVPPLQASGGGEAATIEYAVRVLKVPQVIICGHSHCGAMQAAMAPETAAHLQHVKEWIELAAAATSAAEGLTSDADDAERLSRIIQGNVLTQLEHLRSYPCVADALAGGTVRLRGWVYEFETGQVFEYDAESRKFIPLTTSLASSGGEVVR